MKKAIKLVIMLILGVVTTAHAAPSSKNEQGWYHLHTPEGVGRFRLSHGLFPQSLKPNSWYQIKTPHFSVIFRGACYQTALRAANILEKFYSPVTESIGVKPKRAPVVLRNKPADTNGFFTKDPRRFEINLAPGQDPHYSGANDWLPYVIIHEYRHCVQHARLTSELTNKVYNFICGDSYTHFFNSLRIPEWLFEGDAVLEELLFSKWGRARNPNFSLILKANLLEGSRVGYSQHMFGSYKHKLPDHYPLGYFMTAYMRKKYGRDIVGKLFKRAGFAMIAPFELTLYSEIGKFPNQLHKEVMTDLKLKFQNQIQDLPITPVEATWSPQRKTFTSYFFPQMTEDGRVVALKTGLDIDERFVYLDEGKEKLITRVGMIDSGNENYSPFSVSNNKIVWSEMETHPRWQKRAFSIIKCYDLKKKKLSTLTYRSRYKVPALSPDGRSIIAVETDETYQHRLVLLEASTGRVIKKIANPTNLFYYAPKFTADGKHVLVIQAKDSKKSIVKINIEDESIETLIAPRYENFSNPCLWNHYLIYDSPYSGIDNVYALDLNTNKTFQITSRKYGAYSMSIANNGESAVLTDFTKNGLQVVSMKLDPTQWRPIEEVKDRALHYHAPVLKQEISRPNRKNFPNISDPLEIKPYPVKHYRTLPHLFKLTSFSPQWIGKEAGVNITGNNVMEESKIDLGYRYLIKEKLHEIRTKFTYQGLYPILNFRTEHSFVKEKGSKKYKKIHAFTPGIALPFTFLKNGFEKRLIFKLRSRFTKEKSSKKLELLPKFYADNVMSKGERDIYPRWGQCIAMHYKHRVWKNKKNRAHLKESSHTYRFASKLYFPGLLKQHSFQLALHDLSIIDPFKDPVYSAIFGPQYGMPVWYPDLSITPWFYIKRLSSRLSLNFGYNSRLDRYPQFKNVNLNFIFDTHFFGFKLLPVQLGMKLTFNRSKELSIAPLFLLSMTGENLLEKMDSIDKNLEE